MDSDSETPPPPAKELRLLAIALAVVAIACLGFGSFTRSWLRNSTDYESIGFGLRSNFDCEGLGETKQCVEMSNGALVDRLREAGSSQQSAAFAPLGWVTLVLCALAALGLAGAVGIALARKQPSLPMSPSTLALLATFLALITGCVFVATKPGPAGYVGVGASFWIFGGGAVLGIAASQMLAKVNRPVDPDLLHDAMNPDEF